MEDKYTRELTDKICELTDQIENLKKESASKDAIIKEKELLIWNLRQVLKAIA